MSNDASANPIIVDTVGTVTTTRIPITSIVVVTDNNSSKVELYNTGSSIYKKFFRMESEETNKRTLPPWSPAKPLYVEGIQAVTLTGIAEVLIYKDAA